ARAQGCTGTKRRRVDTAPGLAASPGGPGRREPLLPGLVVGEIGGGPARRRAGRVAVLDPLRVVPPQAGEGDDARVQPRVAYLRDPPHVLAAGGACDRDLVHPRAVQLLQPLEARRRALLELSSRADHVQLAALAGIEGQR